jgi:ABC-2 type transport system permease protein
MNAISRVLWAEALKLRRSNIFWLSALAFALAPLVAALFMVIVRDPEWARSVGLLGAKAQLAGGSADWPTYVDMLQQAVAVGGFVIFGILAIWAFGREFVQSTVTNLLAVPTPREAIVIGKFVVIGGWCAALVVEVAVLGWALGQALGLEGGSALLVAGTGWTIATVASLTVLLITPFGLVASATHSYLPAIGALFRLIFLSQIAAALGWGEYFPWAVPALLARLAGASAVPASSVSYVLVGLTGVAGLIGTLAWWRFADQV